MKNITKKYIRLFRIICLLLPLSIHSCSKYEFREVNDPAYLRVFNCLDYVIKIENKDQPLPFLTMLIDPDFDENNLPVGGKIIGDFLDTRRLYAPPFPNYTGNTEKQNFEFPGNEDVLVAPVLNGFNLSAWAQVPSGKHRILFVSRPRTEVSFTNLEERFRKQIIVDTTINLDAGEVYTLNVLQRDFETKEVMAYLRQENFHKQAFDSQRTYFNVYNLHSKGYWQAPAGEKLPININGIPSIMHGIQDKMNMYLTLSTDIGSYGVAPSPIPNQHYILIGELNRSTDSPIAKSYYSFPISFREMETKGLHDVFASLTVLVPHLVPSYELRVEETERQVIDFFVPTNETLTGRYANKINSLIIKTHSGKEKDKKFSTVSTIELINGNVFLTSVQRTFPAPEY